MARLPGWWLRPSLPSRLLAPAAGLFAGLAAVRRRAYARRWLRVHRLPVPVVVVGNVFVGGTGKTPLVVQLAEQLRARGWRPGIVTRGYGGGARTWPLAVAPDSTAAEAGDEAVLLARRSGCPVYAGPDRVAAARALLAQTDCDVLVLDDGLQYYRLARDAEIVVIDGARGMGNGRCLPAGPLREPVSRLGEADLVLTNGPRARGTPGFDLQGETLMAVSGLAQQPLAALAGCRVHAVAGIGHPERFFAQLERSGLRVIRHPFPDHHAFRGPELRFDDALPIIMTEKDAVKCREIAPSGSWYLAVSAVLDAPASAALEAIVQRLGEAA